MFQSRCTLCSVCPRYTVLILVNLLLPPRCRSHVINYIIWCFNIINIIKILNQRHSYLSVPFSHYVCFHYFTLYLAICKVFKFYVNSFLLVLLCGYYLFYWCIHSVSKGLAKVLFMHLNQGLLSCCMNLSGSFKWLFNYIYR